jgi:hypothetical protein
MAVNKQQLTSGYSRAREWNPSDTLFITNPTQGTNKQELADLTGTLTSGSLTSVAIGTAGLGYIVPPRIVVGTEWAASTAITSGTQIFYGANLYNVTVGGTTSTTPPTNTSGSTITDGTAQYRWVGTVAVVKAVIGGNDSIGGALTLVIENKGSGYSAAPALTVVGGTFAPDLPVEGAFIQCYNASTYRVRVTTLANDEPVLFNLSAGNQTLPVLVTKVWDTDGTGGGAGSGTTSGTEIIAMW